MAGRRSERLAPSGGQQGGERGWGAARGRAPRPAPPRPRTSPSFSRAHLSRQGAAWAGKKKNQQHFLALLLS